MEFVSWTRWLVVWLLLVVITGCSGSSSSDRGEGDSPGAIEPGLSADDGEDDTDTGTATEPPAVSFSADEETVDFGGSTTLEWAAQDASSCEASGGWSGPRDIRGSTTVDALESSTTFTLTCEGSGGTTVAMISVAVIGTISLAWQPPAENEDGSPLMDLSGYRIYYGQFSRSYDEVIELEDPEATQWDIELSSGQYYFAMTAIDADGNESAQSNEVVRSID